MSRLHAHSFRLHGRFQKWMIAAVVVALAAWLFEFSTHYHLDDADHTGSPSAVHACAYCAALPAGAGPVSFTVHLLPASRGHVEYGAAESFSSSSPPAAYRSRAPPG